MHRFPSRDARAKSKTSNSPIYSAHRRTLSALSLLQPSQLQTRASSVVRKVLGSPLKQPALFVDTSARVSCDKPRSSADSTCLEVTRPRSNTSPTTTYSKTSASPASNYETFSAPSGTSDCALQLSLPLGSLLFSPTPNSPPSDDQQDMQSPQNSERPALAKGSPDMCDSGYASGQSSAAGSALPEVNASPVIAKTPRTLARLSGAPLTPNGMNMRLSPMVPRSMMPMPILNLPPLPPTPTTDRHLPRTRSFQPGEMRQVKKTMPALMRHGTSNVGVTHAEEDDDEGSTDDDSDSSETEETVPTGGESSPEARSSINESIRESVEQSGSEDTDYFDAREAHTPLEEVAAQGSGLLTPRASEQNRALPAETSALGLQILPTPGPSTINGWSPWTVVDATPTADRSVNGHASRADYFSHPISAARQALKSPHRTPKVTGLTSLASPRANVSTPQAIATPLSPANTIAARRARAATVLREPNGESPRPSLYQQVSQSMMNLSSPPPPEGLALSGLDSLRSPLRAPREKVATPGTPAAPAPTPLIRRNSMPTMIRHPPSYKEIFPSAPREEEGKEKLPPYSCGIHIEAMMPRKMEFVKPGVLAKDRSWKKQYIVIHGTSLFVYKHDIRKVPIGGKVKGKEKYEGVVTEDEVDLNSPTVHLPGHESAAQASRSSNPPTRRQSQRSSSAGTTENAGRTSLLSRFHGNSSRAATPQTEEPAALDEKGNSSSQSTVSLNTASSSSTSKKWSHNQASGSFANLPHFNAPFSSGNALLRHYTLQGSESGLGSDYYKKRNVIRVRCEGEQFLLQADSVMQVVDWIECLQAGTNVALDLDERPMTKPPPFPRRRRRRRARPADETGTSEATGAASNANASNNNTNN